MKQERPGSGEGDKDGMKIPREKGENVFFFQSGSANSHRKIRILAKISSDAVVKEHHEIVVEAYHDIPINNPHFPPTGISTPGPPAWFST